VVAEESKDSKSKASQAQLDQMMAPVALYPDALLSQILMASTYPEQVTEAAKWSIENTKVKGDDAVKAVADKKWDPSVASLVAFPEVLKMMSGKPDWVTQMGDAFLADSSAVMDTVQTLRKKAKDEGNLKSTEQQKVTTEKSDIIIAPTNPEVVYVPIYNPTVVYGTWWYPSYPPYYYPPPPHYGSGFMVGFGVAIIVHHSMWGGFNWGHGSVNINVNRYNKINVNKINSKNKNVAWNRDNSKRNSKVTDNNKRSGNKNSRQDYRGRDAQREKARANMKSQGLDPAKERTKLSGTSGDNIRKNVNKQNNASNFKSNPKSKPKSSNRNSSSYSKNKKSSNAFSGMNRSTGSGSKLSSKRGGNSNQSFRRSGGGGGNRRR
jgi:hypothetical protein